MGMTDIKIREMEIDIEAACADAKAMLENYPSRGPAAAVYGLRPYIEGKVVCDLGCGGGDLVWLMGRWAEKAIGVEYDDGRCRRAMERRGELDNVFVKKLDYFEEPIPAADVYYFWPNDPGTTERIIESLTEQHAPTTLIVGSRLIWIEHEREGKPFVYGNGTVREPNFLSLLDKHGGELVTYSFRESSPVPETERPEWPDEDTWCLTVLTIE
jgi:hypothetical protein